MMSRTFLMGLLIATAIGGYPFVASIMTLIGTGDTRLPSIALRFGVALLALWVVIANRRSIKIYRLEFLIAFAFFWTLYVFQVINQAFIAQVEMPVNPIEILGMIGLFTLIPTIPLFIGLNPDSTRWGFVLLTLITGATAMFMLLDSRDIALQMIDESRIRFELEKLNPISVGYVGGTLLTLCAVGFFRPQRNLRPFQKSLFAIGMAAGLFTLMISASRGPAVATALTLLVFVLVPFRFDRLLVGAGLGAGVAAFVVAGRQFVLNRFEIDVFARFLDVGTAYDSSSESRQSSFSGAWNQFLNEPILGSSIFEPITQSYPHNLVLEALMATGVFGGLAYLICVGLMLIAALRLIYRQDGSEWIGLLAIMYFIGAQFSGAHYASGAHWLTLVAVVITEIKLRGVFLASRARRARDMMAMQEVAAAPRSLAESELMKPSGNQHPQTNLQTPGTQADADPAVGSTMGANLPRSG